MAGRSDATDGVDHVRTAPHDDTNSAEVPAAFHRDRAVPMRARYMAPDTVQTDARDPRAFHGFAHPDADGVGAGRQCLSARHVGLQGQLNPASVRLLNLAG